MRAIFVLLALVAATQSRASADPPRLDPSPVARLAVGERCTLARLLARTTLDIWEWLPLARTENGHLPNHIGLAVVLDWKDAPNAGLLLRAGESCALSGVKGYYWPRPLRVTLATDRPPPDVYEWIELVKIDGNTLRFERELCKGPLTACRPGFETCNGIAHTGASLPTVVIEVARDAQGFQVTRAALEWSHRSAP
jgi:hypothetical protein